MALIKKMCGAAFFSCLSLTLLLVPCWSNSANVNIKGRVFTQSGPLAGAKVYVYKSYGDICANQPLFTSSATDSQGLYALQLDSGEYYFTAKGNDAGKNFFAYHGNNPVNVDKENIWLSFMANEEKQPVYSDGLTSIQGIVTFKGEPVQNAHVAIYTMDAKQFKGLGFLAEKGIGLMKAVEKDGTFTILLSANKYVVIARKTDGGNEVRPLRKGDLFCYASTNPIEIMSGKAVQVEIPCYPKGDRTAFILSPRIKTNDYLTIDEAKEQIHSGIQGKVNDGEGTPLKGLYVIAYRIDDPSKPTNEAENITETDETGTFFIHLDTDGTYGLVVRDTLGGAPQDNDISGLYSKEPWQGISFKNGDLIENINILIKEDRMLFE